MTPLTHEVSVKKLALQCMAIKKYFYTLILLALIAFKVSAASVHHHHTDDDHADDCELCEFAMQNQGAEFLLAEPEALPPNTTIFVGTISSNDFEDFGIFDFPNRFPFSRPPPFAL